MRSDNSSGDKTNPCQYFLEKFGKFELKKPEKINPISSVLLDARNRLKPIPTKNNQPEKKDKVTFVETKSELTTKLQEEKDLSIIEKNQVLKKRDIQIEAQIAQEFWNRYAEEIQKPFIPAVKKDKYEYSVAKSEPVLPNSGPQISENIKQIQKILEDRLLYNYRPQKTNTKLDNRNSETSEIMVNSLNNTEVVYAKNPSQNIYSNRNPVFDAVITKNDEPNNNDFALNKQNAIKVLNDFLSKKNLQNKEKSESYNNYNLEDPVTKTRRTQPSFIEKILNDANNNKTPTNPSSQQTILVR